MSLLTYPLEKQYLHVGLLKSNGDRRVGLHNYSFAISIARCSTHSRMHVIL